MTAASVFRLTSASRTTSAAWLTIGERISVVVVVTPPARSRARFSTRESPRPVAPPRSIAAATPGEPSEAFVMPVTPIPSGSSWDDEGAGVVRDGLEIDLETRRAHRLAETREARAGNGGEHHVDQLVDADG